jgi:hypothetical protein
MSQERLIKLACTKEVGAEYLSDIVDMSAYELVTRINPLIKRFYI